MVTLGYDMVRACGAGATYRGLSVAIEDAGSVRVPAQGGTSRSLLAPTADALAGCSAFDQNWRCTAACGD